MPAHLGLSGSSVEHPLHPLKRAPLFRDLSPSQCREVADAAQERCFSCDETIFVEGDPLRSLYCIAAGSTKTIRHSATGKLVILQIAVPGDVLDGLGLSLGSTHSVTARAMEDCRVLAWEIAVFERLADRLPTLQRNATRLLARRLRMLEVRIHELATERVAPRLAKTLWRLIVLAQRAVPSCSINLTCEELAQMAGTTQFTVSRLLCDWAEQGIIQPERSAIRVENLPGLISIATQVESEDCGSFPRQSKEVRTGRIEQRTRRG